MCDYSLEMYASRSAKEGETLTTARFPSGSIGLAAPGDCGTAVCCAYGTKLRLDNLEPCFVEVHGLDGPTQDVEFARIEPGLHHDGIKFANGETMPLHRLGIGVSVIFLKVEAKELPPEITDALQVEPPRETVEA